MSDTEIGNSHLIDDESNYSYGVSYIAVKPRKVELGQKIDGTNALDTQVGGDHYKSMAIQPVEFCMKNNLNFCVSSAIKYLCRYKSKNGKQDLEKARHFIDLLIELEYPEKETIDFEKVQ